MAKPIRKARWSIRCASVAKTFISPAFQRHRGRKAADKQRHAIENNGKPVGLVAAHQPCSGAAKVCAGAAAFPQGGIPGG